MDISDYCTNRCLFCYTNDYRQCRLSKNIPRSLPLKNAKAILTEFRKRGTKHVRFVAAGEPLTYPYLENLLKYARKLDYIITIYSNGDLLNFRNNADILAKYANFIRISVNSGTDRGRKLIHRPISKEFSYKNILTNT